MANLVITNGCNLNCPFCFASEYRQDLPLAQEMSLEEFAFELDFTAHECVRLCGGEPTTHSNFCAFCGFVLKDTPKTLFIMTNGLWSPKVRNYLANLKPREKKRLNFMVNVLEKNSYTAAERALLEAALAVTPKERTTLAITIYTPEPDFSYHIELIDKFSFKCLRYSLAAPNISDPRSWYFTDERSFYKLGQTLTTLLRQALKGHFYLQADCSYLPRCYWPEEAQDLLEILPKERADIAFTCHGPIDIGPKGEAWRCFGLKSLTTVNTHNYSDYTELEEHIEALSRPFKELFLKEECRSCPYQITQKCQGGCLAMRKVKNLGAEAKKLGLDLANDIELLEAIATLAPGQLVVFKSPKGPKLMRQISEEWEEFQADSSLSLLILALDGENNLATILQKLSLNEQASRLLRQMRELYAAGLILLRPKAANEKNGC